MLDKDTPQEMRVQVYVSWDPLLPFSHLRNKTEFSAHSAHLQ